jgi:hypothetical protein
VRLARALIAPARKFGAFEGCTLRFRDVATPGELSPAVSDLIKLGPVVSVLLGCVAYLLREGKRKDTANDTLQAALIKLAEKQAETTSLVRDRLRRIEYALKLRKRLADSVRPEKG